MTFSTHIRYSARDGVALVTLDRTDRLNACTRAMLRDLIAAFDEADADPQVRAVIVTGEGRAFCAGAELSGASAFGHNHQAGEAEAPDTDRDPAGELALRIFASSR